jgi:hypothetical protein
MKLSVGVMALLMLRLAYEIECLDIVGAASPFLPRVIPHQPQGRLEILKMQQHPLGILDAVNR